VSSHHNADTLLRVPHTHSSSESCFLCPDNIVCRRRAVRDCACQRAIWLVRGTVVFRSNQQSRITHPPVDIEIWQGSRITRPFVKPPEHHTGLKIACKTQKSQNFDSMSKISLVSRQILVVVEMSNWFFWVTCHTQCRFERNTTVCVFT
jgi:hypothetical protein